MFKVKIGPDFEAFYKQIDTLGWSDPVRTVRVRTPRLPAWAAVDYCAKRAISAFVCLNPSTFTVSDP